MSENGEMVMASGEENERCQPGKEAAPVKGGEKKKSKGEVSRGAGGCDSVLFC